MTDRASAFKIGARLFGRFLAGSSIGKTVKEPGPGTRLLPERVWRREAGRIPQVRLLRREKQAAGSSVQPSFGTNALRGPASR